MHPVPAAMEWPAGAAASLQEVWEPIHEVGHLADLEAEAPGQAEQEGKLT